MPKGACLFHQGVYIGHDSKKVYLAPRVRLLDQAGNTGGCNHMGSKVQDLRRSLKSTYTNAYLGLRFGVGRSRESPSATPRIPMTERPDGKPLHSQFGSPLVREQGLPWDLLGLSAPAGGKYFSTVSRLRCLVST